MPLVRPSQHSPRLPGPATAFGIALAIVWSGIAGATERCAPAARAEPQIVAAVERMFAALRADDLLAFGQVAASGFYAYDGGARFTGPALIDLIRKLHLQGTRIEWSVTEPQVHLACRIAWMTYVNQGSVEDAAGRQPATWLESAVLEYTDGGWRIDFLHSSRLKPVP
jgi:hypothetical protein